MLIWPGLVHYHSACPEKRQDIIHQEILAISHTHTKSQSSLREQTRHSIHKVSPSSETESIGDLTPSTSPSTDTGLTERPPPRATSEPTDTQDTTVIVLKALRKTRPKPLQPYRTPKHKTKDHFRTNPRPQQPQRHHLPPPPREKHTHACGLCQWCLIKIETPKRDSSPREYDEILAIVEPYWHIFNLALEYEIRACVDHHITLPVRPGMPIIITETERLSPNGRFIQAYGSSVYAPWVSLGLRRGSSKFNHCDFSIYLFLHILEPLLRRVHGTVTWFAVEVKPHWVIHWSGRRPNAQVRHSVFSIKTRSGDEYIADFTMEQFGFAGDYWLMRKRDYGALCTTGKEMRQPRPGEIEAARRGDMDEWDERAQIMREVCHQVRDYRFESMDRMTMIRCLEVLVKEICWYIWHDEPAYRRFHG